MHQLRRGEPTGPQVKACGRFAGTGFAEQLNHIPSASPRDENEQNGRVIKPGCDEVNDERVPEQNGENVERSRRWLTKPNGERTDALLFIRFNLVDVFAQVETAEAKSECHARHHELSQIGWDFACHDRVHARNQDHAPVDEDQNLAKPEIFQGPRVRGQDRRAENEQRDDDGGEACVKQNESAAQNGDRSRCDEPARPISLCPKIMHERMNAILPAIIVVFVNAARVVNVIVDEILGGVREVNSERHRQPERKIKDAAPEGEQTCDHARKQSELRHRGARRDQPLGDHIETVPHFFVVFLDWFLNCKDPEFEVHVLSVCFS